VKQAELVIESGPDDDFLRGRCSSCPDVRFDLMGNTLEEKKLLRAMFDIHFRQSHMLDDASAKIAS
jgi:hypothetical protein